MRGALALLIAGLAIAPPALAQFGAAPKPGVEAEAHIVSAFTSRADPRVLDDGVKLGPALRAALGADADGRRVYDSLVALIAGKPLRTRSLPAAEAASHASLPGLNVAQPLVMLEAGDVRLLLQYAPDDRNVAFVEQLAGPAVAAPTPPQAPKPEPIVEVPLPTEPPPAPPVAAPAAPVAAPPAPVAAPPAPVPAPPAPVAVPPAPVAPRVTPPVAVQKPAAPAPRAEKPRPRGECVIKPVMSEQDLWNCSAPGQASVPRIAVPAPVATQPAPPPSVEKAPAECVVKPVMSEEDLRNCAVASRSRPSAAMEVAVPVAAQPAAPQPAVQATPRRECVIKPVMSEEDLKACAAASRSRPAAATEPPLPVVAAPAPAAAPSLQAAPQRECVIKPVMSEEDLRICAAASKARPAPTMETSAPQPVAAQPANAAPPQPRECVIKPVMSEEDLRACGTRR